MRVNLNCKQSVSSINRKNSAFSLIEVMIGVLVAGGVMAAVYAGVASGFQTMQLTRENLRATQIMVERLEAIRGSSWFNLTNTPPSNFSETQYTPVNGAATGVAYSGIVTIETPANVVDFTTGGGSVPAYATMSTLRAVTVTLTWTNRTGTGSGTDLVRTRSMSTFVSEHGLQSYVTR